VVGRFGRVDVLVNNVGGNGDVLAFVDTKPDDWQYDLDINIRGTLLCTHAVLPHMIARGEGRIINIGSMSGIVGDRLLAVYSAAKGAVHAFTKVLACEVGPSGITVNAIAPYGTPPDDPIAHVSSGSRYHPTDGVFTKARRDRPDEMATIVRKAALPRGWAKPAEIGAAAVYLASEPAAFITGEILCVDGGVRIA
jgi:NAD(P)-dependent dehydrogenase (short-subunit alcohol dehydrogenase family)